MPLTTPQKQIFDDINRFRVVSAGRRFGKTYLSTWEIARAARFPNKRIFYVAPSYRMAKQILWDELKQQMFSRRWASKANESDLSITLRNGSVISLRSADNFDSMRGVSLDFVVLDECSYMPMEAWTQVLRPTLSDRAGKALFISTPNGYNWFADLYAHAQTASDWAAFQFTTIQGGNVPPEEVEAARHDLDPKTFRTEYEATFESAGNIIYYSFDMHESVKKHENELPKVLHIGMDFNIDPMCASIAVQSKEGLHLIDEIVIPNSNTDEMAKEIKARYPTQKIVVYPDPAGSARKTSAGGRTDHAILAQYGFEVKSPRAHAPVKDRINAGNRLLQDADGLRRLWIDPKCKETIKCISKHQYKEGTSQPDKDSGYDHMNDSWTYMVHYLYPIKKPVIANSGPAIYAPF